MTESRTAGHFQRLYNDSPDPWSFAGSPYEQAKYHQTLLALGDRRFASGLKIDCSIGVLTRMLAPRCDALLGVGLVEQPLAAARARCADQPWVRFERMWVPAEWPGGRFDLIVLSEVLYFLTSTDIDRTGRLVRTNLAPGACVLLVNWLGQSDDPCNGDEAAGRFIAATTGSLHVARQLRQPDYRLDLLVPA